jgi:hypothetical protein
MKAQKNAKEKKKFVLSKFRVLVIEPLSLRFIRIRYCWISPS